MHCKCLCEYGLTHLITLRKVNTFRQQKERKTTSPLCEVHLALVILNPSVHFLVQSSFCFFLLNSFIKLVGRICMSPLLSLLLLFDAQAFEVVNVEVWSRQSSHIPLLQSAGVFGSEGTCVQLSTLYLFKNNLL